jgi:hypothetical protein
VKLEFSRQENPYTSNFKKILPVDAELFHADGRTDRHDEAFRNFANAPKMFAFMATSHSRCSLNGERSENNRVNDWMPLLWS